MNVSNELKYVRHPELVSESHLNDVDYQKL